MPNYGVTIQHGYGGSASPLLPDRAVTHLVFCGKGENPVLVAATRLMRQFPEQGLVDKPIELVEVWNGLIPPIQHGIRQAKSIVITNRDENPQDNFIVIPYKDQEGGTV